MIPCPQIWQTALFFRSLSHTSFRTCGHRPDLDIYKRTILRLVESSRVIHPSGFEAYPHPLFEGYPPLIEHIPPSGLHPSPLFFRYTKRAPAPDALFAGVICKMERKMLSFVFLCKHSINPITYREQAYADGLERTLYTAIHLLRFLYRFRVYLLSCIITVVVYSLADFLPRKFRVRNPLYPSQV